MSVRFDQPLLLWLLLLIIPVAVIGWRALRGSDGVRRAAILLLRSTTIALVICVLAGPRSVQTHDHLTVIGLVDISGSVVRFADLPDRADVPSTNLAYLRWWFQQATADRRDGDRVGLVVFDGRATVVLTPTSAELEDDVFDVHAVEGTNIADALRLGVAMFPAQTLRRLVLITDGNETRGDVLAAAREAAGMFGEEDRPGVGGIGVDVVPVSYRIDSDVQVVRVEAPSNAQPGQVVTVRMVLESIRPLSGTLSLQREGQPVDLTPGEPGFGRAVQLPAGRSIHLAQVELLPTPVNRFEAVFEPDDPAMDPLPENNRAQAMTATPSRGSVLFVSEEFSPASQRIPVALEEAGLNVRTIGTEGLPGDLLSLQAYDLVILQNIGATEIDAGRQRLLSAYVNDMGGGLIKIGGERSFGAGGWSGTALEPILPVKLDLPREVRLSRAALVLVLDRSGSMNARVAGARASQQEIANEGAAMAIESLRPDSMIGVVTFDTFSNVVVPIQPNENPQAIADRVRGITSGGGTTIGPAMRQAYSMLQETDAEQKMMIVLSDGVASDRRVLPELAARIAMDGITVSTIGVGDMVDDELMLQMAELGGGEYFAVTNPQILPRVLVDSVQVLNRPLIREYPFQAVALATGSTVTAGVESAPALQGLVLTAPREDPRAVMELVTPEGEPILAHWQAGLGRVAAFTSDSHATWSAGWRDWSGFDPFWTQLARMIARPPLSQDFELSTRLDGDTLEITLDALGEDDAYMDMLNVSGTVYSPGGETQEVRLRQVGPGRYQTSVPAAQSGNYIIALAPRRGQDRLPPVITGANQPAGAEYRQYQSNTQLLQAVQEMTGGRLLDIRDPAGADLFDRTGMAPAQSVLPAWRGFLWWLMAVLLVDVASRRIAWDGPGLQRLALMMVGRVSWKDRRGARATATLSGLRQSTATLDAALKRESTGFEKLRGDTSLRTPSRSVRAPVAADRSAVLSRLAGESDRPSNTAGSAPAAPAAPSGRPTSPDRTTPAKSDKQQDGIDRADDEVTPRTTRELLARKRRLRDEQG